MEQHINKMEMIYNEIKAIKGFSFHKKDLIKCYRKMYNELKEYCRYRNIDFKTLGIKGI